MIAIDDIASELANRGWSLGDLAYYDGASVVWQVFGHCNEQRVLARAPGQKDAWRFAAIQIVKVRRAAFLERLMAIELELQEVEPNDEHLLEESDAVEYELGWDEIFRQEWLT
jgi:hypothetical protein